jgi:hypothetical protein
MAGAAAPSVSVARRDALDALSTPGGLSLFAEFFEDIIIWRNEVRFGALPPAHVNEDYHAWFLPGLRLIDQRFWLPSTRSPDGKT